MNKNIFTWKSFIALLGKKRDDADVEKFLLTLDFSPTESSDPGSPRDPNFTNYLEFNQTGICFCFRLGRLNHIFIYMQKIESYSAFKEAIDNVNADTTLLQLEEVFGLSMRAANAYVDPQLGQMRAWQLYRVGPAFIHFEFADDGKLGLITVRSNSE